MSPIFLPLSNSSIVVYGVYSAVRCATYNENKSLACARLVYFFLKVTWLSEKLSYLCRAANKIEACVQQISHNGFKSSAPNRPLQRKKIYIKNDHTAFVLEILKLF